MCCLKFIIHNYITLQNKKNCTKKTELNQRNSYDTFVEKYTSQLT